MKIKFTKMQGLGNDFIIIDYVEFLKLDIAPSELAKKLCKRHFSIGADGLIILNPEVENADIGWMFYNSDGSVAQMCGNGMRCFAKYVADKTKNSKSTFTVETLAGIITPEVLEDGKVKVNMNLPVLEPSKIPFNNEKNIDFDLEVEDRKFNINAISMGNPHCVIFIKEKTLELAKKYGKKIENNSLFPEKTNVEFVNIISRDEVSMSVWERGCGITLACGTGACATVVAGILRGYLNNKVKVNLLGGSLIIEWAGNKTSPVFMTGSANYSFTGTVEV